VALVTGASRGVGAAIANQLAQCGTDVVINYRSKGPRAEQIAAQVRSYGRRALLAQADLTEPTDLDRMATLIATTFGRLDVLVLNASGGLEKDRPPAYAMQLNLTAQIQTVDHVLPLMSTGSTIIFVTSHWAHFHGQQPVLPAYEPIAASKKAGEEALRERIPEFTARGIRLCIVSGDVIEGTITPKLLERIQPGIITAHREQSAALPTIEEFAGAIVAAALNPALPTGHTVFVGDVTH
jgi:NAD(P)-dependent dehydrogenase (short-subunit alcohol dehydrogenase family)